MLRIDYEATLKRAVLDWQAEDEDTPWAAVVRRLLLDEIEDAAQETAYRVSVPWWAFLSLRGQLLEVLTAYGLRA